MINPKDIIQTSAPTANITVNASPITSVPTPVATTLPPIIPESHRPVAITAFLWILFIDLIYKIVSSTLVITRLIASFRINHGLAHIYETSPLLCYSPLVYAVLATVLLVLIFKTIHYTIFDFVLLIVISLLIPITYTIYTQLIGTSLNLSSTLILFSDTNILSILILILLLVFPKNFSEHTPSLSDNSTILLAILGSIVIFPSFAFVYSLINTSLNPDLQQHNIQTLITHKIYSPSSLPLGLRPDTTFFIDPSSTEPLIRINYSSIKNPQTTLRLDQVIVTDSFDPAIVFPSSTAIDFPSAKNKFAYQSPNSLTFITTDNVLITLTSSSDITSDHLLSIAKSLH